MRSLRIETESTGEIRLACLGGKNARDYGKLGQHVC